MTDVTLVPQPTSHDFAPLASISLPRDGKHGKHLLPKDFVPSSDSVLCGRGKKCTTSPGNKKMRRLVDACLESYSKAGTKLEKSAIVSRIVHSIKVDAPKGAFVKFESGRWWEVDDGVAREKIGCLLRDCLHTQYKSSTKAKLARRRSHEIYISMNAQKIRDNHHGNIVGGTTPTLLGSTCLSTREYRLPLKDAGFQNQHFSLRLPPVQGRLEPNSSPEPHATFGIDCSSMFLRTQYEQMQLNQQHIQQQQQQMLRQQQFPVQDIMSLDPFANDLITMDNNKMQNDGTVRMTQVYLDTLSESTRKDISGYSPLVNQRDCPSTDVSSGKMPGVLNEACDILGPDPFDDFGNDCFPDDLSDIFD